MTPELANRRPPGRSRSIPTAVLTALFALAATGGSASEMSVTSSQLAAFAPIPFPPTPTALLIANSGALVSFPGMPEIDDTVTITFSKRLAVGSVCSAWSGDSSDQSIAAGNAVTVSIENNAASTGNDRLVVSVVAGSCPTFRFGHIDLGSRAFVTATVTFGGTNASASTVEWRVTARQLVVTLGAASGLLEDCTICPGTATAVYTPNPGITDPAGTPIVGTAGRTAVHF